MTPSFYIEETKEMVLVKPNGVMEFFNEDRMVNSLSFESESQAINYAKDKRWREVPTPI